MADPAAARCEMNVDVTIDPILMAPSEGLTCEGAPPVSGDDPCTRVVGPFERTSEGSTLEIEIAGGARNVGGVWIAIEIVGGDEPRARVCRYAYTDSPDECAAERDVCATSGTLVLDGTPNAATEDVHGLADATFEDGHTVHATF